MAKDDGLSSRLQDEAGRAAVAAELGRLSLAAAARLATRVVEAKRSDPKLVGGAPRASRPYEGIKDTLRARLSTLAPGGGQAAPAGELARALWALDRGTESVRAILAAALAIPDGRSVLPPDLRSLLPKPELLPDLVRVLDAAVRSARGPVRAERVAAVLPFVLLRTEVSAAAERLRGLGWGDRELGRLARVLSRGPRLDALFEDGRLADGAWWALEQLLDAAEPGPGQAELRTWLDSVAPAHDGPALPRRLPLTLDELRELADLLGEEIDADDPSSACDLDGSTAGLARTLANHLAEAEGEEPSFAGKAVDVRQFLPFERVEVLGADGSGDVFLLDPRRRTRGGTPPVVRYCHDRMLVAELEANGVFELAARSILARWAGARGASSRPDVRRLLDTPVVLLPPDPARPSARGRPRTRPATTGARAPKRRRGR